jgi:hypothetical protein
VRVLKHLLVFPFLGDSEMGGENQKGSLKQFSGYFTKAQCTGKLSYLEPISQSLHVPTEGVYRKTEKIEDRVAIGEKHNQNHVENALRTYLEPIRNTMQKPVEGLLAQCHGTLNKGAIDFHEHNRE